jgi:uncharacterized protein
MIVDVSVHPVLDDDELRRRIGPPWSKGRVPHLLGTRYQPPFDEIVAPLDQAGDPASVARELFDRQGVDLAVVTPLTRGLLPNPQQAAAVASAANDWVAERWLDADPRFVGSLRVATTDIPQALEEIARLADDERFVQLVLPLRTFHPYGDQQYFPLFEAAVAHNLPVAIFDDDATVVEHHETPVGAMRYFSEKHALRPLAGIVHLSSLITCGVFDRLPELKVIVGDGAIDVARPMMWRVDRDWRQGRVEVPWVEKLPSSYLPDHVRFVSQPEDGAPDAFEPNPEMIRIADAERLLLYGSHYPYWDHRDPVTVMSGWDEGLRRRVLGDNALDFIPRLAALASARGGAPSA